MVEARSSSMVEKGLETDPFVQQLSDQLSYVLDKITEVEKNFVTNGGKPFSVSWFPPPGEGKSGTSFQRITVDNKVLNLLKRAAAGLYFELSYKVSENKEGALVWVENAEGKELADKILAQKKTDREVALTTTSKVA